jgi:hypothetical protein
MVITRARANRAAAKAVSTSREKEKRRKSAARTREWRKCQSEERRSEIRQPDLMARLPNPAGIPRIPVYSVPVVFFHRNHDSCSAGTFSEPHRKSSLYGAYVGSYVGNAFAKQIISWFILYYRYSCAIATYYLLSPGHCYCCHRCPKHVGSFGYGTDFLTRRSVRSDIDSVRKL